MWLLVFSIPWKSYYSLLTFQVVLSEAIKHPYAVAVFENSLYWSDWTGQEIQRCNKFTGKDRHTVVREKNNRVFGVHIYHPAMMNSSVSVYACVNFTIVCFM